MKSPCFLLASFALSAAAHATSVTVTDLGDYGYPITSHQNPSGPGVETHVIGVYETDGSHSGNNYPLAYGRVEIKGDLKQPINLVLSSYTPTNWILFGEGLGSIASVLVNGYHTSSVAGIDASKVIDHTGLGRYLSACSYKWPGDDQGCDTASLIAGVESHYGTPVTSFTGVYHARGFAVSASPVPEASSLAYLLLGLPVAAWARRQRHKA